MKSPLPHQYPFLLLDRVVEVEKGRGALAIKNLTLVDPLIDGEGRIAAALLAEAMAQCSGAALAAMRPGAMAVLASVDRFRCRPAIMAGSRLEVRARIARVFGKSVKARCVIRVEHRICAAGEIILQFVDAIGPGVDAA